ncbi:MAG: hypothetical protein RLZZ501_1687 [Pseudomonadota bacterium]|jgi:hypothetical protein
MLPGLPQGAADQLLPPALPGRFFAAAVLFHLAAWAVLAWAGPDALIGFSGGAGPVAAALHLITLGTLAMTAIGAAIQMLPVITNRPLAGVGLCHGLFWLYAGGVALLSSGLALPAPRLMAAGGGMVSAGLALFALLVAAHLRRGGRLDALGRHLALALAALAALAGLGLALLADFSTGWLGDHRAVAAAHAVLGAYGFMGMLAFGFSTLLLPMFVLGPAIPEAASRRALALAAPALACGAVGAASGLSWLAALGAVLGAAALLLHLHAVAACLRRRMRRRLESFFVLLVSAWAMLGLSLALGLALALGAPADPWAGLWGLVLVLGWLLGFVLAILQRILPFLAAMHSAGAGRPPLLPSRLAPAWAATLHGGCHLAAVALLALGLVSGLKPAIWLGLAAGLAGAAAFLLYAAAVPWRALQARRPSLSPPPYEGTPR